MNNMILLRAAAERLISNSLPVALGHDGHLGATRQMTVMNPTGKPIRITRQLKGVPLLGQPTDWECLAHGH